MRARVIPTDLELPISHAFPVAATRHPIVDQKSHDNVLSRFTTIRYVLTGTTCVAAIHLESLPGCASVGAVVAGGAFGTLVDDMVPASLRHLIAPGQFADRLHVFKEIDRLLDGLWALFSQLTNIIAGCPNRFTLEMTKSGFEIGKE